MSERDEFLELYADLRVADVRDGLDWNGMMHYGSVSTDIRPLWRTRAIGIARTARYLPFEGPAPTVTGDEYTEWSNWYYGNVCTYPWEAEIQPGDFVVIDQSNLDVGLLGSNNTLQGLKQGVRGYLSNGGVRDTDEVILQKVPAWCRHISQTMVQGRLQFDAMNVPVAIGGVTVRPGDVIVADGDGIVVVPSRIAREVAEYAHQELRNDKESRRAKYEALGLELDDTVQ